MLKKNKTNDMRKFFTLILASLTLPMMADGLMVGINSYDEEITNGCVVEVSNPEVNPVTGAVEFQVDGTVLTSQSSLTVTITRDVVGLTDQLCIGTCLNGDGTLEQTLVFSPLPVDPKFPGMYNWFAHFEPDGVGSHLITYSFSDGQDTLTFSIRYVYGTEAIDEVSSMTKSRKMVRDGQLVVIRNGVVYNVLGATM